MCIGLELTESEIAFGIGYDLMKTLPAILKPDEEYQVCSSCGETLSNNCCEEREN